MQRLHLHLYEPAAGQFLSMDPALSQTLQPYAYANGNPVSNADPTGRCSWTSSRCWEYWALDSLLEIGAAVISGLIIWFCDDVSLMVCAPFNAIIGRATMAAGLAIASCWWWRGCSTWKAYVAVGVAAFFGVATAGVLGRIFKNPARLYSFRFGIAWYIADFSRWFRT